MLSARESFCETIGLIDLKFLKDLFLPPLTHDLLSFLQYKDAVKIVITIY